MTTLMKSTSIAGLFLALAALGTTGCGQVDSAPAPTGPPQVSTVTVQAQSITLTTELPGRTAPFKVAEIRPQVNGIIQKRPFTEGDDVASGSLLYQIDPAPYQAAYDQATAALAVAEAQVPAARSRAERLRKMVEVRAAGEQDAVDAEAAALQAEAAVTAAKAALESARVNLEYTPITAPISGRIGRSVVTVGALVTAYQPNPLAMIQQLDPIYVDVTQATSDLLRLRHATGEGLLHDGDGARRVALVLEDGSTYPLEGTLAFRDVTVDPTTGSVTVRMLFPNPDHLLLPGMYVRAVIEEGVHENAVLVPQQGVTRDNKGNAVAWLVNPDRVVEQRMLDLDRAIGDQWLVNTGLSVGDQLIVEGRQKVRPGATVEPAPFTEEDPDHSAEAPAQPMAG